jgi:hypothetical protein
MALLTRSKGEEEKGVVPYDNPGASVYTLMTDNGNMMDFTKSNSNN